MLISRKFNDKTFTNNFISVKKNQLFLFDLFLILPLFILIFAFFKIYLPLSKEKNVLF
jgi:hypothetical protein